MDPELTTDLETYASLLRKMGWNPEAIEIEARVNSIRIKHSSADHSVPDR